VLPLFRRLRPLATFHASTSGTMYTTLVLSGSRIETRMMWKPGLETDCK
jgi:hypothetical protein